MNVLLDICGVQFLTTNAAKAAKVADLLAGMKPCDKLWLDDQPVLVMGKEKHRGDIHIVSDFDKPIFKDHKAYLAAKAAAEGAVNRDLKGVKDGGAR